MKIRSLLLAIVLMSLWAVTASAAGPVASLETPVSAIKNHEMPIPAEKLVGDPGDFLASAVAGADYIRYMQADFTEDNAGNGPTDSDTNDAGWDWVTTIFEHSTSSSAHNLYGVTANGMYQTYQFAPTPGLFTAMKDAADEIVATGPTDIRSSSDIIFLINFASLSGVADPAYYIAGADAIWQYRLASYADATEFAEALLAWRANANGSNGLVAWDTGAYAVAIQKLSDASGGTYDADADAIAEVVYQDALGAPVHFDVYGACQGADPTYTETRYYWYTLGISRLIETFLVTDTHTAEIPLLLSTMMECQYDWGAFSWSYGADPSFNDAGDQDTAYACMTLAQLDPTVENQEALNNAAYVLSYWQDASGGQVYSNGNHYPEVGAECTAAMALAWMSPLASVNGVFDGVDPVQCGDTKNITFSLDVNGGTPGVRGYELTLKVTGPVQAIVEADFTDEGPFAGFGNHYFNVVYDSVNDEWIVNDAILGATPGLLDDADLVTLSLVANGDGAVDVDVVSLKLRDPQNAEITAVFYGDGFTSDCTPPAAVDTFVGNPGHEKVLLDWTMADISDVAAFEIYRSVWYDGDNTYDSAYPEYDDLANDIIPARPGSRASADALPEWTLIHTALPGDVSYVDNETVRGIYYYEIFAMDAAGNFGPPAVDPVWAMNYWLGDVSDGVYTQFDGFVDVADITSLGSYFGMTNLGLNHVANHIDVGPTHDNSRLGIPATDDAIDFEDLMIFAMNYNVVSAAKSDANVGSTAYLVWSQLDDGRYVVGVNQANGMQGLHITANVKINAVTAGDLVAQQEGLTFMTNVGSRLDANVAVMGLDKSFVGDGDLFIINAGGSLDLADLVFDARGSDNSQMEVSFEQTSGVTLPTVYTLGSNYPNPFNPMTKISFSLPEAQAVKLTVYGLDGRKVATLVNEQREAGTYDVNWMGRDDQGQMVASGTYFYRIDAGPYSQVRKMTLMK